MSLVNLASEAVSTFYKWHAGGPYYGGAIDILYCDAIHAGYLSRPGESAACLPRKVAVKLVAVGESGDGTPDTYIS